MATARASTEEMTVLRIKRKRTDDPLNALVVHNCEDVKKKKVGDASSDENNLFRYSGTVDEAQINSTKHVVKNFQIIYQQTVRHDGHASKEKAKRREMHQAHQKLSRYRIISEKRADIESVGELPLLEDNEIERMYRIYDVVAEDDNGNETSARDDQVMSNDEKIFCNNVEMLREKLHIGENVQPKEDEYVYDLYLAPGGAIVMGDNEILNVEEYYEDVYAYTNNYEENAEECYEDEDDENDENNWRNQYPEDESHSSENECKKNGDYSGNSSGEEDYVYSRYRDGSARLQFDPYAPNLQEDYYYTVADDDPYDET